MTTVTPRRLGSRNLIDESYWVLVEMQGIGEKQAIRSLLTENVLFKDFELSDDNLS